MSSENPAQHPGAQQLPEETSEKDALIRRRAHLLWESEGKPEDEKRSTGTGRSNLSTTRHVQPTPRHSPEVTAPDCDVFVSTAGMSQAGALAFGGVALYSFLTRSLTTPDFGRMEATLDRLRELACGERQAKTSRLASFRS